jgi:hypothetical protein
MSGGFGWGAEFDRMLRNVAAVALERILERGHFNTHVAREVRWRVICPLDPNEPLRGTATIDSSKRSLEAIRVTGFAAVETLVESFSRHRQRHRSFEPD